jgi:urease accessory protein
VRGSPGSGVLEIVRSNGKSVVSRACAHSPLRLLTPRNHGHAAWVYTGSYGGGLLGGDRLAMAVRVGTGACGFLSTQASTKVYRSHLGADVTFDATVAADATLVVWPDPVVCFRGSRYQQRQHVALDPDGAVVIVDTLTSGRHAAGERWRFDGYSNRLTVRYGDRPLLCDAQHLTADDGDIAKRLGRFDVLCTIVVIGQRFTTQVASMLSAISSLSIERNADTLVGAAPLADAGCIARVAGRSTEHVGRVVRGYLSFVPCLLGDDPWSRKW